MIDTTVSQDVLVFFGQLAGDLGPLSLFGEDIIEKVMSDQTLAEVEQAGLTVKQQMTVEAEALMFCLANPTHRVMVEQLTDRIGGRSEALGGLFQGRLHYAVLNRQAQGGYRILWPVTPEALFAMFLPLSKPMLSGCEEWSQTLGVEECFAMLGAVETVRSKRMRASLPFGPAPRDVNHFTAEDVAARLSEVHFDRPPFGGIQGMVSQALNLELMADQQVVLRALDSLAGQGIIQPMEDGGFRPGSDLYVMAERLSGRQDRMLFWLSRHWQGTVEQSKICVLMGHNEPSYTFEIVRLDNGTPAIQALALSNEGLGQLITSLYLLFSGDDEMPEARQEAEPSTDMPHHVFCGHCGAKISVKARFCDECGKPVTS